MITLSASAIAFVILLVTMACRSIWQLFR
jgi:hypothetical protein